MDLVDDEDLVTVSNRENREAFDDDLADVVDARMCRRVNLEDVDVAPFRDLDARVAFAAGIGGGAVCTVERARQDTRRGRLSDAARSREDEGVGDSAAGERIAQGPRHRQLPDDVVEALRPPFARDHLIGHNELVNW